MHTAIPDAAGYKQLNSGIYVPANLSVQLGHPDPSTEARYRRYLQSRGRAEATVDKYCLHVRRFLLYLGERYLTVSRVREWLEELKKSRNIHTVNSAVTALNGLFRYLGRADCTVSFYPHQDPPYREDARCLDIADFRRLLLGADYQMRTMLLTFFGTGIRVSELQFFTEEAVRSGRVTVDNKGKVRTVFLDPATQSLLLDYCRQQGIRSGPIFHSRAGRALSRAYIWRCMKTLAKKTGVALSKVFPHNLRHLFAVERYKADKDIESLRLDMGHSVLTTTQRYLKETVSAHFDRVQQRAMPQME